MTTDAPRSITDALAEVLDDHQTEQLWKAGGWAGDTACSCGWRMAMWSRKDFPAVHRAHVAEQIASTVAGMVTAVKAEALREAADCVPDRSTRFAVYDMTRVPPRVAYIAPDQWLRDRAAAQEAGEVDRG